MSYRRTPHAAPRLAGRALKIMVRLLESPITRPLVAARFERELGIARLRAEASDDASETCLNRHVEARADDRGRDGSPRARGRARVGAPT